MSINAGYYFFRQKPAGFDLIKAKTLWTKDIDKKTINNFVDKLEINFTDSTINGIKLKDYYSLDGLIGKQDFPLVTTYPGLVLGAGLSHPALTGKIKKDETADYQLGFYFDHTTGLPVIPGSSVKGVLKSVFPKPGFPFLTEKLDYINKLLEQKGVTHLITPSNWENIFFKRRQVFLDAYISAIPDDKKIFADDYITPHKELFKDPQPLRFLKIAPGVEFTFQFVVCDFVVSNIVKISGVNIRELFKQILIDFGVGAKTNVGYGMLCEPQSENKQEKTHAVVI